MVSSKITSRKIYIYTSRTRLKIFKTFVQGVITKENTPSGSERELSLVERAQVGPASTPKYAQSLVIRCFTKKKICRCVIIYDFAQSNVNEIGGRYKGFILDF